MDISSEIAAIQAASQGSELRQPLIGALNKLNSGSLPAVTASDAGKILKVGANGWEIGEKSGYMPVPTATKQITENGTHDVTDYASAVVNVSGGGGGSVLIQKTITQNGTYNPADDDADGYSQITVNVSQSNNINFVGNWDFANPVNTRGNNSYSKTTEEYTINGWYLTNGKLDIESGGIRLSRRSGYTGDMYFYQRYNMYGNLFVSKNMTLSLIVDGELYTKSFVMPNANGIVSDSAIRYGVDNDFAVVYYSNKILIQGFLRADSENHILNAIKLECGNSQTLATKINNVWVLNYTVKQDEEYVKTKIITGDTI